jgi:hypothetical protein
VAQPDVRAPAVRVSAARDLLDFLDRFEPGARARVLELFPAASRDAIENSPRTSWLPVEHDHFTVDGVVAVLGRERALECWRDSVPDIVDKPLLRTFVSGMVRAFGRDPTRILGLFPKAWPLVFRDCCEPSLQKTGAGEALIVFEDVAPEVRMYPNYFLSWQGISWGLCHISEVNAEVRLQVAPDRSRAVVEFKWA